jgi:hypothetical protein
MKEGRNLQAALQDACSLWLDLQFACLKYASCTRMQEHITFWDARLRRGEVWSSSAPVSPAITDSAVSRAASRNGSCACSVSADCVLPLHATPQLQPRWVAAGVLSRSCAAQVQLRQQMTVQQCADRALHGCQSPDD